MFSCRFDFTTPDNVHFQQAAQISKALVENQVDFEAMVSINEWMKVMKNIIKLWHVLLSLKQCKHTMFFSGTPIRITGCLVKHVTISTHTWTIFCRTALLRTNKWALMRYVNKKCSSSIDKTLLMTDALHVSLYIEHLKSESMTLILYCYFYIA